MSENAKEFLPGLIVAIAIVGTILYVSVQLPKATNEQIAICVQTCKQHLTSMSTSSVRQNTDGTFICECTKSFKISKDATNVTDQ